MWTSCPILFSISRRENHFICQTWLKIVAGVKGLSRVRISNAKSISKTIRKALNICMRLNEMLVVYILTATK